MDSRDELKTARVGWWLATDGQHYPPEQHPDYSPTSLQPSQVLPELDRLPKSEPSQAAAIEAARDSNEHVLAESLKGLCARLASLEAAVTANTTTSEKLGGSSAPSMKVALEYTVTGVMDGNSLPQHLTGMAAGGWQLVSASPLHVGGGGLMPAKIQHICYWRKG